jgi:hypothetical protein
VVVAVLGGADGARPGVRRATSSAPVEADDAGGGA